jgi:hypothetical protein
LISTQQPAFEQERHQVSFRKQLVAHLGFFTDYFVSVSQLVDSIVTLPAICLYNTVRFYIFCTAFSRLSADASGTRCSRVRPIFRHAILKAFHQYSDAKLELYQIQDSRLSSLKSFIIEAFRCTFLNKFATFSLTIMRC